MIGDGLESLERDCSRPLFAGTVVFMASILARVLVGATCFSAFLAPWPNGLKGDSTDEIPSAAVHRTPSCEGVFVDDADERGEGEEREDEHQWLVILAADRAAIGARRPPTEREGGPERPGRQPAPSPASIRGPPRAR